VPGCPPSAEALLYGTLPQQKKIRRTGTMERGHDMSEALSDLAAHIREKLGDAVPESALPYGGLTVTVSAEAIVAASTFLRDDPRCQFVSIIDICGADYPGREKRFDIVYHLLSPRQNLRIRLKVHADEETIVPSVTGVWQGADW